MTVDQLLRYAPCMSREVAELITAIHDAEIERAALAGERKGILEVAAVALESDEKEQT